MNTIIRATPKRCGSRSITQTQMRPLDADNNNIEHGTNASTSESMAATATTGARVTTSHPARARVPSHMEQYRAAAPRRNTKPRKQSPKKARTTSSRRLLRWRSRLHASRNAGSRRHAGPATSAPLPSEKSTSVPLEVSLCGATRVRSIPRVEGSMHGHTLVDPDPLEARNISRASQSRAGRTPLQICTSFVASQHWRVLTPV